MAEPAEWLAACDLPAAWAGQAQWRVLETGFGLGLNFLATWQAWRDDPARPGMLHFAATEVHAAPAADLLHAAGAHPSLQALADELAAQWQGLLPGTHRLVFEGGRVLLTLGVGDAQTWLKTQHLCVDSVYLGGFRPPLDGHWLKAVARCCHRGTRLASWTVATSVVDGLQQVGFKVSTSPDAALGDKLQAVFNPAWEPRKKPDLAWPQARSPQRCLVIGAGLAGAAAAASLARRGWAVTVLDANAAPASGASGLPAGFLAPHVSADDGVLSRLSRSGLRATWQAVTSLLKPEDGRATGVLQRRFDASAQLPSDWPEAGAHWSHAALGASGDAQAPLQHPAGGWVKPARLVEALLQSPGVKWHGGQDVASLKRVVNQPDGAVPAAAVWRALNASGVCLAEAELVVVAAGPHSAPLLRASRGDAPPLQPVRGQVVWGTWPAQSGESSAASALPATPVNGLGGLIPKFPALKGKGTAESSSTEAMQSHWLMSATYERDEERPLVRPEDTALLLERLMRLWPTAGKALAPMIKAGQAQTWAGVRCASPDRLPLVGPVDESTAPGLWLCTAMGSRGLTFAVLSGELMAAWLHAEPLPLEKRLAQHLLASRFKTV